jgi:Fe2+ or Zn2+ uptake regulation protein
MLHTYLQEKILSFLYHIGGPKIFFRDQIFKHDNASKTNITSIYKTIKHLRRPSLITSVIPQYDFFFNRKKTHHTLGDGDFQ